jgi:hypothetical protein
MTETEPVWGLAAVGRSGSVSVDVYETTTGKTRWELNLGFPQFQLRFTIPSPDAVSKFHNFLAAGDSDQLVIGVIASGLLTIIRDSEFDDRFFLMTTATDDTYWHDAHRLDRRTCRDCF